MSIASSSAAWCRTKPGDAIRRSTSRTVFSGSVDSTISPRLGGRGDPPGQVERQPAEQRRRRRPRGRLDAAPCAGSRRCNGRPPPRSAGRAGAGRRRSYRACMTTKIPANRDRLAKNPHRGLLDARATRGGQGSLGRGRGGPGGWTVWSRSLSARWRTIVKLPVPPALARLSSRRSRFPAGLLRPSIRVRPRRRSLPAMPAAGYLARHLMIAAGERTLHGERSDSGAHQRGPIRRP